MEKSKATRNVDSKDNVNGSGKRPGLSSEEIDAIMCDAEVEARSLQGMASGDYTVEIRNRDEAEMSDIEKRLSGLKFRNIEVRRGKHIFVLNVVSDTSTGASYAIHSYKCRICEQQAAKERLVINQLLKIKREIERNKESRCHGCGKLQTKRKFRMAKT